MNISIKEIAVASLTEDEEFEINGGAITLIAAIAIIAGAAVVGAVVGYFITSETLENAQPTECGCGCGCNIQSCNCGE